MADEKFELAIKRGLEGHSLFISGQCGTGKINVEWMKCIAQGHNTLTSHGGGKVTSKAGPDCIKLAEKGSSVSASDFFSTKFIEDCVKMNKFLDTSAYRIPAGSVAREGSDKSFSSDDSMSPASTIIKTSFKSGKGRNKYTKEEDIAIMNFLVEERRYREASGMRVWKDMQMLGITDHSAESMNSRFRKVILPNIESYSLDVSPRWISLLSGNITRGKSPEYSADALFKPRPNQNQSPAKKPAEARAFSNVECVSKYFSKSTPSDNDKLPDRGNEQTSQRVSNSKTDLKRGKPESDGIITDLTEKRMLRKRTRVSDQEDHCITQAVEGPKATEVRNNDEITDKQRQCQEKDKSRDHLSVEYKSPEKIQKQGNQKKHSEKPSPSNHRPVSVSQRLRSCSRNLNLDITSKDGKKSTTVTKSNERDGSFDLRQRLDNKLHKMANNSNKVSDNDNPNLSKTVGKQHNKKNVHVLSNSKDKSNEILDSGDVEVSEKNVANNDDDKSFDSDGDYDSFDKMLEGLAEEGSHIPKQVNIILDSEDHMGENQPKTRQCKNKTKSVTDRASSKVVPSQLLEAQKHADTSHSKVPHKQKCAAVLHDTDNESNDLITVGKKQISKGPADSTTDGVLIVDSSTEEDDEEVIECRKMLQSIGEKFGLPAEYVRQVIYRNNGYIDRTISWIKYGVHSPWPPAWSEADDLALTDEEEIDRLFVKYGEAEVHERLEFLGFDVSFAS